MNLVATALEKMNIPHDSSCHEVSMNESFIQVRNLEGQNHPGHTVIHYIQERWDICL